MNKYDLLQARVDIAKAAKFFTSADKWTQRESVRDINRDPLPAHELANWWNINDAHCMCPGTAIAAFIECEAKEERVHRALAILNRVIHLELRGVPMRSFEEEEATFVEWNDGAFTRYQHVKAAFEQAATIKVDYL